MFHTIDGTVHFVVWLIHLMTAVYLSAADASHSRLFARTEDTCQCYGSTVSTASQLFW